MITSLVKPDDVGVGDTLVKPHPDGNRISINTAILVGELYYVGGLTFRTGNWCFTCGTAQGRVCVPYQLIDSIAVQLITRLQLVSAEELDHGVCSCINLKGIYRLYYQLGICLTTIFVNDRT